MRRPTVFAKWIAWNSFRPRRQSGTKRASWTPVWGNTSSWLARHGAQWDVGALTDRSARDPGLDLSFPDDGILEADIYRDGPNADRVTVDYVREKRAVSPADRVQIHLAPGGGWSAGIYAK